MTVKITYLLTYLVVRVGKQFIIRSNPGSRQCTVYQAFTWVFLAALLILFIILLATVLVMRKRNSKSKAKAASQSVFSVSARSYGGESSIREDSLQPTSPREAAPNFSNFPAQKFSAPIFPAQSYPSPDFVDRRRSTKHQWRESVTDYRL